MRKFDLNIAGLARAMRVASLALRKPRMERHDMIQQLVGAHYSEFGATKEVPVNLISLYTQIIGPSLIANNPRVMLSSFDPRYKRVIATEQLWVNKQIERTRMNVALRRTVLNALFQVGIGKVALATPADSLRYAWLLKAGQPYYADVSPSDFLYDVHAQDFDEVGWMGHKTRVPLSAIKDSKLYAKKVRERLSPQPDPLYNAEGDERASVISRGYYSEGDEFEDMVTIWEIYLPRHRAVVTLAATDSGGVDIEEEPLRETEWIGPEEGPYLTLGYGTVPDNAMPIAPLANLMPLHMAVNNCWRKLLWQCANLKNVTAYAQSQGETADRLRLANNGDLVPVVDPKSIQPITMNQPDQTLHAIVMELRQLYDELAGNLALQGGLGAQSKTAHQDEMLNQNASRVTTDRQNYTKDFVAEACKRLLWFHHHHPTQTMVAHHQVQGADNPIRTQATPADRWQVPFEDMDVRVDPYSLTHKTPQQRLSDMNGVVTQIVLPMMQLLVQQGKLFDIGAYLKKVGEWMDEPELADIMTLGEVPPGMDQGGQGPAGPSNGTRTYERVSRPGTTPQGDRRDQINKLMAGAQGNTNGNGQLRAGM